MRIPILASLNYRIQVVTANEKSGPYRSRMQQLRMPCFIGNKLLLNSCRFIQSETVHPIELVKQRGPERVAESSPFELIPGQKCLFNDFWRDFQSNRIVDVK